MKMTCPQPRTNRGIRSLQSQCEVRTLREKIVKLQRELSSSKAETQNLAKQLKCLSLLVKGAWCGDMTAARHVAKIVGAAPPVMKVKSGPEGEKIVVVQTQPKVLHNWAFLTTRLLNKKDIKLEDLVCHLSTQKLEQREAYLDEQMETHDEILEATPASLKMASSSLHSSRARLLVRPRSGFVYNAINENTKTCLNDTEGFVLKKERPHSSTAVQEKKIQRSRTCLSASTKVNRNPHAVPQKDIYLESIGSKLLISLAKQEEEKERSNVAKMKKEGLSKVQALQITRDKDKSKSKTEEHEAAKDAFPRQTCSADLKLYCLEEDLELKKNILLQRQLGISEEGFVL